MGKKEESEVLLYIERNKNKSNLGLARPRKYWHLLK